MVTAGTEIMVGRSAQVARGLNTISANIVEQSDLLAQYGITVVQANGDLTSTYDVLKQLKPVWDELTDAERQSLGQSLAGKNQYRVLAAVMQNFEHAVEATETAVNSAGSAMRENAAYMESLESKSTLLKSTFQTLANDVIPKELIAKGLDVLDKFLKLLDTDLGVVFTRITMLTGIGWGFSSLASASKILPTIISQFGNFVKVITGAGTALVTFQSVALPIIAILTTLGTVIGLIIEKEIKNKQAIDEMSSSAIKFKESINGLNKSVTEEKAKIEATASSVDIYLKRIEELDKKLVLNNSEQAEYHSLLQKIVEVMPSVASSIDLQNDKIIGGTSAIYDQVEAWKKLAEQQFYQTKMADLYETKADMEFQLAEQRIKLVQKEAEYASVPATDVGVYGFWTQWTDPNEKKRKQLAQDISNTQTAIANLESQLQGAENKISSAENTIRSMFGTSSDTDTSDYPHRDRTPTGEGKEIRRRGRVGEETEETAEQAVGGIGTTTSNVVSSIEEKIEEIVFNLQDFISLSQSEIDLLESEYSLMEAQGASSEELNAKIKEIQDAYHSEAEILRTILSRAEEYNLTQEEINDIQTEINNRSIDWWNWQNKINNLLKDAETSTENIEENVDDIYARYEEGIAKLREEERERAANYKDDETYQYWNLQIQLIDEYIAQLQKSNEQLNEQLKLQEKLDNLARAKESRLLVYKDGTYQYIEDVDAVSKAARELSDVQREQALAKTIEDLEYTKSAYQAMAGAVEEGRLGSPSWANTYLRKLDRQGGWQEVFGYAGGTTSASGGLSLVGEKGAELRILNKGDGILPSNLTENLMRWGQMTPNQFKSNSIGGFGSNMAVTIQALNLPNVSNGADFVNYIKNHMFGKVLNLVH